MAEASEQEATVPTATTPDLSKDRDALAAGLLGLLRPAVEEMDARVAGVRESQQELGAYIETLAGGEYHSIMFLSTAEHRFMPCCSSFLSSLAPRAQTSVRSSGNAS